MCGSCEGKMGKVSMKLGALSLLLAVVLKVAHLSLAGVGPRSLAAAAALFLLLAIAANTTHAHDQPHEH